MRLPKICPLTGRKPLKGDRKTPDQCHGCAGCDTFDDLRQAEQSILLAEYPELLTFAWDGEESEPKILNSGEEDAMGWPNFSEARKHYLTFIS